MTTKESSKEGLLHAKKNVCTIVVTTFPSQSMYNNKFPGYLCKNLKKRHYGHR